VDFIRLQQAKKLSKFSVMDPMFLYRRDLTNYDQRHIHMWTSLGFNKQRSYQKFFNNTQLIIFVFRFYHENTNKYILVTMVIMPDNVVGKNVQKFPPPFLF
jgi:hypothetical protein